VADGLDLSAVFEANVGRPERLTERQISSLHGFA
jgi:hypothetical protein